MAKLKFHTWENPYTIAEHKKFEEIYRSGQNLITLEQLENMNLEDWEERLLFGRTSKEWRKQLK